MLTILECINAIQAGAQTAVIDLGRYSLTVYRDPSNDFDITFTVASYSDPSRMATKSLKELVVANPGIRGILLQEAIERDMIEAVEGA